ncbi:MAG: putative toxin-antitoxin system toxin component, PIN family [Candidatus Micrarchaeia archaeon]|jgi:putative PIN family toxin of toxin-antitoxin system
MNRVVLDTNVVVSGTFWSGASFQVMRLVGDGEVRLVLSSEILCEYSEILSSEEILAKTSANRRLVEKIIRKISNRAIFVAPTSKLRVVKDDPDDDKFIEAAVAGGAGFIVTQDKHLLKLVRYGEIEIVTPETFLSTITQRRV